MARILVVDDERAAREPLASLLTAAGHMAVTAANGRDAWLTLYEGVPDLVLLDLMMPQMDGVTFLSLLRRSDHWSHVPVLVVTGLSSDEQLVAEARAMGVAGVLSKTNCGADHILALVEQALARPQESPPCRPPGSRGRRSMAYAGV